MGSSRATVQENVPVCLPRDGNGTGRREAIWLTGRDGSQRFLGTGSWNGSGRGREIGRVHSREIGRKHSREINREHGRESVGNIVGKTVGNIVGESVGNVVGIWPRDAVRNGREHDRSRERGLETTVIYKEEKDTDCRLSIA